MVKRKERDEAKHEVHKKQKQCVHFSNLFNDEYSMSLIFEFGGHCLMGKWIQTCKKMKPLIQSQFPEFFNVDNDKSFEENLFDCVHKKVDDESSIIQQVKYLTLHIFSKESVLNGTSKSSLEMDKIFEKICEKGYANVFKIVFPKGKNDCFIDELVHIASQNGHLEIIKYFQFMEEDVINNHVFKTSCVNGHLHIAEYLLLQGLKIRLSNKLIVKVCKNGHEKVLQFLIKQGASVKTKNNLALKEAIQNGHLPIVQYLVSNENFKTGFFYLACKSGHLSIVKYFVSLNIANTNLDTGMIVASRKGHLSVVDYLISLGANIRVENELVIKVAVREDRLHVIEYLLSKGANGHVALIEAIRLNKFFSVEYLVSKGIKSEDAFYEAVYFQRPTIANYLISQGILIDKTGPFTMVLCCLNGYLEFVKFLVAQGADIHKNNDESLYYACSKGHLSIVEYLVSQGANIHAVNGRALEIAKTNHHSDVVTFLISKMSVFDKTSKESVINSI